jgi:AraC-like DNA-binding protein
MNKEQNAIVVGRVGVNVSHLAGFVIDRPQGSGDYVFIHFTSAILLASTAGRREERPDVCIIYAPPFPQWYSASIDSFSHNWFHFSGNVVPYLLKQYSLPVNTPFYPHRTGFIPAIVNDLFLETCTDDSSKPRALELHLERLFLNLHRALESNAKAQLQPRSTHVEQLQEIRHTLFREPQKPWAVSEMAKQVFVSRSRFTALYQELFHVSPMEDVLRLRVEKACWLLAGSRLSVKEVAMQSGFEDQCYFNRLFTKRMGLSPGRYRHQHQAA